MVVDCDKSLELLSDFRDGALTEIDVTWITSHLDGCIGCKGIFEELEMIVVTARTLGSENGLAYPDENLVWQRIGISKRIIH